MVLESISFLLKRKIFILHPHIHIAIRNMYTGKKSNIHFAQKTYPNAQVQMGILVQTHPRRAGDGCAATSGGRGGG
jgi:hypothetical protein